MPPAAKAASAAGVLTPFCDDRVSPDKGGRPPVPARLRPSLCNSAVLGCFLRRRRPDASPARGVREPMTPASDHTDLAKGPTAPQAGTGVRCDSLQPAVLGASGRAKLGRRVLAAGVG